MNRYYYIARYDKEGVYLDSFYEIQSQSKNYEESLLRDALHDIDESRAISNDALNTKALELRARYNSANLQIVSSEMPLTRDTWEQFLKMEQKYNPDSRWLK